MPARHLTHTSLRRDMFQSAPRPFDRGDRCTRAPIKPEERVNVSIRAPAFRPGRLDHRDRWSKTSDPSFNPRPGLSTGAITADRSGPRRRGQGFNPRPGLSTGAIPRAPLPRTSSPGFNPRPAFRPGRFVVRYARHYARCFNPRPGLSTGAIRRGRDRRRWSPDAVSIRAPAFRPGRLDSRTKVYAYEDIGIGFNPRPGLSTGAMCTSSSTRWPHAPGFQSAPRPFDRGDSARSCSSRHYTQIRFNPRPGLSTGAIATHSFD